MILRKITQKKNKKGVSPILGYVMLVTLGLIMSGIAYNYLKTYVPQEAIGCPDGVGLLLKDYACVGNSFNITLKNNGKFDIAGYYIRATNESTQKLAMINLAGRFMNSSDTEAITPDKAHILFSLGKKNNFMTPKVETDHYFNISNQNILTIEITPIRYEMINNKERFAICSDAKIKEPITCLP